MTTQQEIDELNEAIAKAQSAKASLEAKRDAELKEEKEVEGNEFFAVPELGTEAFTVFQTGGEGRFVADSERVCEGEIWTLTPTTEEHAEKFAEALNIWKEWNACKGAMKAKDGIVQFLWDYEGEATGYKTLECKGSEFSPCFDTEENCEASIEKIGKDRIRKMRNYFHFNYED